MKTRSQHEEETSEPIKRDLLLAVLVAYLFFCVFMSSSNRLPATWDEGFVESRAASSWNWSHRVLLQLPILHAVVPFSQHLDHVRKTDTLTSLFSKNTIESHWKGTTSVEGHPQWPVILASVGLGFSPNPTTADLRFGPIVFFSLAVGIVFYRLKREFGSTTACFGILSILAIPRLFAHAQIAAWDSALTASWMLCWAMFFPALKNKRGSILFGICLGLTLSSKFSGWAVFLPFGFWVGLRIAFDGSFREANLRRLPMLASLAVAVSLFVFFVLNPPLWNDPVGGFATFFRLNTQRDFNVAILFLGKMYDLHHSLPWYNTAFWIAVTVPSGLLLLAGTGFAMIFASSSVVSHASDTPMRWNILLILLNMSTLPLVRAFPGTPVHDGVRLFVSAFPFLAMAAGVGATVLWNGSSKWSSRFQRCGSRLLVLAIYLVAAFNMFWYAPQWLSYYNILIGGLPGAVHRGMEPTYYWDGFDDEVIGWLKEHTVPGEMVAFSVGSRRSFDLDRNRDGRGYFFHAETIPADVPLDVLWERGYRYYVLQRRPSAEFERDRYLIEHEKPVFTKTIRHGGYGPWNLATVPILEIYRAPPLHGKSVRTNSASGPQD